MSFDSSMNSEFI